MRSLSCCTRRLVVSEQSGNYKTALILQAITVAVLLITVSEWNFAWLHTSQYAGSQLERALH